MATKRAKGQERVEKVTNFLKEEIEALIGEKAVRVTKKGLTFAVAGANMVVSQVNTRRFKLEIEDAKNPAEPQEYQGRLAVTHAVDEAVQCAAA